MPHDDGALRHFERHLVPLFRKVRGIVHPLRVGEGFLEEVGCPLHVCCCRLVLNHVLGDDRLAVLECFIRFLQVLLQHIHAVGHCGHHIVQSGTVGAECCEDTASLHLLHRHFAHVVEHGDDGFHCLSVVDHCLQHSLLYAHCLLDGSSVRLYLCEHLIECRGSHFGHETHCVAGRAERQQLVGRDVRHVGQTHQSLGELNDICPCAGAGGRKHEHGAGCFLHSFLHAVLRDKSHDLRQLGHCWQRIFTEVFAQSHLHLLGSTHEPRECRHTSVFLNAQLGTGISKIVELLHGVASVNLGDVSV